jgi:predicted porin
VLAASAVAVWLSAARANASVTLFDRDGWTFQTTGLVAAHYQLVQGDADPLGSGKQLIGGRIFDEGTAANQQHTPPSLLLSNVRSGFIGTQIGFGLSRQISQDVRVESLLAASVNGINSNRGQDYAAPKGVDYREAWAQVVSPYGTVRFGRMFGMFGSGSAAVQVMAWQYGVGHPCVVNQAGLSCGSSGAGPIYPGFDAAFRYISPRLAGFQLAVSVADPNVGNIAKMSPTPRVDTELNFDQTIGGARIRAIGQTMWDRIGSSTPTSSRTLTIWGVMGTALLDVGPFSAGGGAWTGAGVGERIPLEAADPANPIAWDSTGELRKFLGVYGNAQFNFAGNAITLGGGELFVKLTDNDLSMNTSTLTLQDQYEGHAVFTHKFADCLVLNVEFMHWHTDWQADPTMLNNPGYEPFKQSVNFMGGGLNYVW